MNDTASTLMSIVMLAAFVLAIFGARLAWRGAHRKQGLMMVLVAAILIANVLIWAV